MLYQKTPLSKNFEQYGGFGGHFEKWPPKYSNYFKILNKNYKHGKWHIKSYYFIDGKLISGTKMGFGTIWWPWRPFWKIVRLFKILNRIHKHGKWYIKSYYSIDVKSISGIKMGFWSNMAALAAIFKMAAKIFRLFQNFE